MARVENFPGRLGRSTVASLPPDVRVTRARYLSDAAWAIGDMYRGGVRTEVKDDEVTIVSLDAMTERGYQVSTDGTVYEPTYRPEEVD